MRCTICCTFRGFLAEFCSFKMRVLVQGSIVLLILVTYNSAFPNRNEVLNALNKARTIGRIEKGLDKIERNPPGKSIVVTYLSINSIGGTFYCIKRCTDTAYVTYSTKVRQSVDGIASSKRCPMAMTHGKRLYGNATLDRKVNEVLHAMRILRNQNGFSSRSVNNAQVLEMFKKENGDTCSVAEPPACDNESKYRSADGSCNNLRNPGRGMAKTSQVRLLPNAYDDQIGTPRTKGVNGGLLPNPRVISNLVHNAEGTTVELSKTLTLMAMGFGQFLDHDITLTPEISEYEDCCEETASKSIDNCFNIVSSEDDEFQDIFKKDHCIEFKRSSPVLCPDDHSTQPVRQQLNIITSFIDASNVYGSSIEEQKELRDGDNGEGYLLKTSLRQGGGGQARILNGLDTDCLLTNDRQSCSKAGDIRVNEVPSLTSMHFLFVKEHNRIANILKDFYPNSGSDETIFQEAKRILTAVKQMIVYDEFLPSFLSENTLQEYRLKTSNGYRYDRSLNPSIINSFAAAAYRMGHTWIPEDMLLFEKDLELSPNEVITKTDETFHNPELTYRPQAFAKLMYWLSGAASPETDRFLVEEVRSSLFVDASEDFALDLAALNIQRGRDHGLPSYNEYRTLCGQVSLKQSWAEEPLGDMVDGIKEKLIEAGYDSPLDIDLFTGGLLENPVAGGTLGQTFECIIGKQFNRLKFGDRYWFQNNNFGFEEHQIAEIQKYSFSKLLCVNYNYEKIQYPSAFKFTDPFKQCADIEDIDFKVFDPNQPPPPPQAGPQKKEVLDIEKEVLVHLLEELENE